MKHTGYIVNYKGGAGPTKSQSENNDKALAMILKDHIPFDWSNKLAKKLWGGDEMQIHIQRSDGNEIYVSYDRWGFVIDGIEGGDQTNTVTTLELIKKWYEGKIDGGV